MLRPTRSLVPVALIAAALLTAGSSSTATATEGRLAQPLVIGSVASLSGDGSSYGRDQARGSSLAVANLGRDGAG
jgi:ABC-type branched-subunit amino acid transport system substrate-binding protein